MYKTKPENFNLSLCQNQFAAMPERKRTRILFFRLLVTVVTTYRQRNLPAHTPGTQYISSRFLKGRKKISMWFKLIRKHMGFISSNSYESKMKTIKKFKNPYERVECSDLAAPIQLNI